MCLVEFFEKRNHSSCFHNAYIRCYNRFKGNLFMHEEENEKMDRTKEAVVKNKGNIDSIIPWGVCMSYFLLYLLWLIQRYSVIVADYKSVILTNGIAMAVFICLFLVFPFERIASKWLDTIVVGGTLYGVSVLIGILFFHKANTMQYGYGYCFIIFLLALYFSISIFECEKKGILLVIYNLVLIFTNFYMNIYLTKSFYVALTFSLTLLISCIINMIKLKHQNKILIVGSYIFMCIIFFVLSLLVFRSKLNSWFNPMGTEITKEVMLENKHTLYLADKTNWEYLLRHPFVSMFTMQGVAFLALFLVVFVVFLGFSLYSKKILSKIRYELLMGMALLLSIILICTLLADLGYFPTMWISMFSNPVVYIEMAMLIRLFIQK